MIKPLNNQVIVLPEPVEEITEGGIALPDTISHEKPSRGKVVSAGDKTAKVKQGDIVIFTQYSTNEIEYDKVTYLIMDESDILAVIG